MIQLGRKSGILQVARGEGPTSEEGEVVFVHGQVSRAQVKHLSGQNALAWLNTWGTCRFLFHNDTPERITQPLPAVFPPAPPQNQETPPYTMAIPQSPRNLDTGKQRAFLAVPKRVLQTPQALARLERAGLTRTHRRLFLLIDGQRNLAELARLINRDDEDVLQMIQELTRLGLIYQL